tara:strand:- start:184 stop:369 length:186 start_codon:yes stop_codon:yes gene_type:complete
MKERNRITRYENPKEKTTPNKIPKLSPLKDGTPCFQTTIPPIKFTIDLKTTIIKISVLEPR